MTEQAGYEPDVVYPPGDTLREILSERKMTQADLARRMSRPEKTISEIIGGRTRLTNETALELETVVGVPAQFWSNLQAAYDRHVARQQQTKELAEQTSWLKGFPASTIRALTALGWVRKGRNKAEQVRELLRYFAVASVRAWDVQYAQKLVAYRASKTGSIGARAAWFRRAEQVVEELVDGVPAYSAVRFERVLGEARLCTAEPIRQAFGKVVADCREAGVLVALVRELPCAGVSGATFWRGGNPAIVLTLRYKTNDHFWFSFFHEAGHVLRHARNTYLEVDQRARNDAELEADRFAADFLIPPEEFRRFASLRTRSSAGVTAFAKQVGVAPGIVVGRLQHERLLPPSHLNRLKVPLAWPDE
jgi:addiction module HigA family antidote